MDTLFGHVVAYFGGVVVVRPNDFGPLIPETVF